MTRAESTGAGQSPALITTKPNPVYVFVFAHPDDESMFFLPTIRSLVDTGETIWFLCLTTGDYDGLGKIREKEMERAGRLLGASKVVVRNDAESEEAILDHPTKRYDKTIVAAAIQDSLSKSSSNENNRYILITFDEVGVSGHVNHIDTYLGVRHLMEEKQQISRLHNQGPLFVEAWYLESERNVLIKYIPFVSWVLLILSFLIPKFATTSVTWELDGAEPKLCRVYRMHSPRLNWDAMSIHHSQFVWYRRLFVVFSAYTYYNKLTCTKSMALESNRS